ncbi:hypothetical protein F66182_10191 [Fusarium sp. NRRL 66182]|nr:hypothetical protein F66182_10191 [Fusarium sp. NRRL 66182]
MGLVASVQGREAAGSWEVEQQHGARLGSIRQRASRAGWVSLAETQDQGLKCLLPEGQDSRRGCKKNGVEGGAVYKRGFGSGSILDPQHNRHPPWGVIRDSKGREGEGEERAGDGARAEDGSTGHSAAEGATQPVAHHQVVQSCPRLQKPSFVLRPVRILFSSSLQLSPSTVPSTIHNLTQTRRKERLKAFARHHPLLFYSLRLLFLRNKSQRILLVFLSSFGRLYEKARVPVPFSIFPSTYRESESHTQTVTETHEKVEIKPQQPEAGREGQYSSISATAEQVPPPGAQRISEEEVRITREEERYRRPGVQNFEHHEEHFTIREDSRRHSSANPEKPRPEPPSHYQPPSKYHTSHSHVEIDTHRHPYYSTPIDLAEREYRQRYRPAQAFSTADPSSHPQYHSKDNFQANNYTVEGQHAPHFHSSEKTEINNFTVDGRASQPHYHIKETEINNVTVDGRSSRPHYNTEKTEINNFTVDNRSSQPQYYDTKTTQVNNYTVDNPVSRPTYKKDVRFTEETVETSKVDNKSKMGYYDDDGEYMMPSKREPLSSGPPETAKLTLPAGQYHSFRSGMHKLGDRVSHGGRHGAEADFKEPGPRPRPGDSAEAYQPNTVTIPCHHIRLGDFVILQGRPCQVIRISTSSATGQYRYLGVDLFTKQLHEESSFIANPAPSVVVQTMLGPVFKQYRVLDMQEGQIVAMTETGDVKQGLPVIDQSNLYARLSNAFESGRGSVRVLVLNDGGRELAVDMKVIHGSRL